MTEALRAVIAKHEMLRSMVLADGQQLIVPQVPAYQPEFEDWSRWSGEEVTMATHATINRLRFHAPMPGECPQYSFVFSKIDDFTWRLLFRIDALLIDGESRLLLLRELCRELSGISGNHSQAEGSYRDFVDYERAIRDTKDYAEARSYWRESLPMDATWADLPLDYQKAQREGLRLHQRIIKLCDAELWEQFSKRAADHEITATSALLALLCDVVAATTGTARFLLGVTGAYRPLIGVGLRNVVGNFNTVQVVASSDESSLLGRASQLQKHLARGLDHRIMNGFDVIADLNQRRGTPGAPVKILFNSVVGHPEAGKAHRLNDDSSIAVKEMGVELDMPQVALVPTVGVNSDGALYCFWKSAEGLMKRSLSEGMLKQFGELVRRFATGDANLKMVFTSTVRKSRKGRRTKTGFNPSWVVRTMTDHKDPQNGNGCESECAARIAQLLAVPFINLDDDLADCGLTSFDLVRLSLWIKEKYDIIIDLPQLCTCKTPRAMGKLVARENIGCPRLSR
jgi:acyl carrier protein